MAKDSVKYPEKWVTALLVLATLAMMLISQLIGNSSHYVTFVAIPGISIIFWMDYANIKPSTNRKLWFTLSALLAAWSILVTAFLFLGIGE